MGCHPWHQQCKRRKVRQAAVGDLVLFAAKGRIFGAGTVALKFHNHTLAARLWDFDDKGTTWEYMYALDEWHRENAFIA